MAIGSYIPATKSQKDQVVELHRQGKSNAEIATAVGLHMKQIGPIKAHSSRGSYDKDVAVSQEAIEGLEEETTSTLVRTSLSLERDLQHALRSNIAQLEAGLRITDGGKERTVDFGGRIDILAEDSEGGVVVIELKVGTAEQGAISQILAYMGALMDQSPTVRGIIVAKDFSPSATSAARATPNIRLLKYTFNFSFERVGP